MMPIPELHGCSRILLMRQLELPPIPELAADTAGVTADSLLLTTQHTVVLEELSFPVQALEPVTTLGAWLAASAFPADTTYDYWRQRIRQTVVVLPEEAFRYFVEQTSPVLPRIRIDDTTGMAAEGSLWNEEYLPPETLLYALIGVQEPKVKQPRSRPAPSEPLRWLKELGLERLQLGGRRTLGRGLVQVRWSGGKEQS